ncbi:MAG: ROK family protein [Saprospiraceae bacterium]|nr:ROK family protein [Lewinella sp.]
MMDIGIDIGGTHIKGVLLGKDTVVDRVHQATRDGEDNWQETVAEVYRKLSDLAGGQINSVGISAPGIADKANRAIAYMPVRLQGLERFIWSDFLGRDTYVLNDAHAALWAESQWGAGKGILNQMMLTLGTGVGGGLLVEGRLLQGFLQRAGHLGHISVDASSEIPSITGITGSLEEAVGETSLSRRSRGRFETTYELVQAHLAGDTWATYIWLDSIKKLALGISSLCNALSPELVVLAGGITKAGDTLMNALQAFMELYEWRPGGQATPIRIAHFKDYAGAIGAALFARSRF